MKVIGPIDDLTGLPADPPTPYVTGDPETGVKGSKISGAVFNMIQSELAHVVDTVLGDGDPGSGQDGESTTQLLEAIQAVAHAFIEMFVPLRFDGSAFQVAFANENRSDKLAAASAVFSIAAALKDLIPLLPGDVAYDVTNTAVNDATKLATGAAVRDAISTTYFPRALGNPGHFGLPGGTMVQFGRCDIPSSGALSFNYELAFPTACIMAVAGDEAVGSGIAHQHNISIDNESPELRRTRIRFIARNQSDAVDQTSVAYIAIGY